MFGTRQQGGQVQRANPVRQVSQQVQPNLGMSNPYLQQLMQRYMLASPSYQNLPQQQFQPQAQGLLNTPAKQYDYTTPQAQSLIAKPAQSTEGCPPGTVLTSDGAGGWFCGPSGQG